MHKPTRKYLMSAFPEFCDTIDELQSFVQVSALLAQLYVIL